MNEYLAVICQGGTYREDWASWSLEEFQAQDYGPQDKTLPKNYLGVCCSFVYNHGKLEAI